MPLFFYSWKDADDGEERASLLVDERDEKRARAIATDHHGAPPNALRELPPGVFAAEILFYPTDDLTPDELEELTDEDEEAGDQVACELLPHVDGVLRKLEDSTSKAIETLADIEPPALRKVCGDENETEDGRIVRCDRTQHGEERKHEGGGFTW